MEGKKNLAQQKSKNLKSTVKQNLDNNKLPTELEEKYLIIIFGLFYLVGAIGHILPLTKKIMFNLTPYVLLISSLVVYFYFESKQKEKFNVWVIGTYIFTFIAEAIGTNTGLLFGKYSYTNNLGFRLMNVPLVIGLNWVFIVLGSILIAKKAKQNIYITSLLAALITVMFDIILEPAAIKLQYWSWWQGKIPIYNYITWFILSGTIAYFYLKSDIKTKNKLPIYYLLIQVVFFAILLFLM
jgi:putative membrane protein